MKQYRGWLFDLYAHPEKGLVLWLVGEDDKPHSFHQDFEIRFYARGPFPRLRELGMFLRRRDSQETVRLERVAREDLFDGLQQVMCIAVSTPTLHRKLFRDVQENFSDLVFYDVDIPLTVRYAAAANVFMMAHCEVVAEPGGRLVSISDLDTDTPDGLETRLPHLRVLSLRPDADPSQRPPQYLVVKFGRSYLRVPFNQPRELLNLLNSALSSFDPDVIQTHFGDAWLFSHLQALSDKTGIHFHPNRDPALPVLRRKEVSFFNYGHAHYRAPQVHLRGRWHVDVENCMTYNQYQLIGAIEQTRLSSLPLQEVARRSPGAAISAMQTLTALKRGILVPYQRQKGEIPKTFNQLFRAARGGLVFQPPSGVFRNVAVLDFSSKMASIMIKYNVSPETVTSLDEDEEGLEIAELGVKILSHPGLIPQTLKPMRDKRLALKRRLRAMDKNDPRQRTSYRRYKAVTDALKWLTVVCYGRLGFANSIFGRLNAHEVVSYLSRKTITQAKLIAEEKGFDVLHVYVDSLFVSQADASREDFQALVDEIEQRTGLPMDLENIYAWFAFPGSRQNPNISVANRFYGVAENGEHKIRGVALRRGDTCAFVASLQSRLIQILARETDPARLAGLLPEVLEFVQSRLVLLKNRDVPMEQLVVSQVLSREPDQYSVLSPLAAAVRQLQAWGKTVKMGQRIRFIYIGPGPGVQAWGTPNKLDPRMIDVPRYRELAFRAVHELLQPLGVTERILRDWLFSQAGYVTGPGQLGAQDATRLDLPLFTDLKHLHMDTW